MKKILNFLSWKNMVGKMKVLKVLKVERLNLSGACELMSPPSQLDVEQTLTFSNILIFRFS